MYEDVSENLIMAAETRLAIFERKADQVTRKVSDQQYGRRTDSVKMIQ